MSTTNPTNSRLAQVRACLKRDGLSAVIIPQADPHMSEYLSAHWQSRRYLSGFGGSAGDLVITLDQALLWTDSRYFLQAADQLAGSEIQLMKDGTPGTPGIGAWLAGQLKPGETVGIDGLLISTSGCKTLQNQLEKAGLHLRTDYDIIDEVWHGRPALPQDKIYVHEDKYAGMAAADKLSAAMLEAKRQGARAVFVSALDEIAWALNLRCNDVHYNPVFTSYLYIGEDSKILFVDPDKLTPEILAYLAGQGVATRPYDSVKAFLVALPAGHNVLTDSSRTAAGIAALLGERNISGTSVMAMAKACKNDVEVAGEIAAHLRDGVAMVRSLREIEERMAHGEPTTELDVCAILRRHRSEQALFVDESFGTIAGYGPHGAIVHYEPTTESNAELQPGNLLLIDSGAQYLDGTTDITRTISLGKPTAGQKRDYTLVAKGHIALASAVFPEGTFGSQLDVLARQYLWQHGLTYLHGTGHGVGHFLNVHEGPQSIRLNHVPTPLCPGMITSNEPGVYIAGQYGIRIENLVLTVKAFDGEYGPFLRFDTITLCPFDNTLLDTGMMTREEIDWLNEYHARVRSQLLPLLDDEADRAWLTDKTQKI